MAWKQKRAGGPQDPTLATASALLLQPAWLGRAAEGRRPGGPPAGRRRRRPVRCRWRRVRHRRQRPVLGSREGGRAGSWRLHTKVAWPQPDVYWFDDAASVAWRTRRNFWAAPWAYWCEAGRVEPGRWGREWPAAAAGWCPGGRRPLAAAPRPPPPPLWPSLARSEISQTRDGGRTWANERFCDRDAAQGKSAVQALDVNGRGSVIIATYHSSTGAGDASWGGVYTRAGADRHRDH